MYLNGSNNIISHTKQYSRRYNAVDAGDNVALARPLKHVIMPNIDEDQIMQQIKQKCNF